MPTENAGHEIKFEAGETELPAGENRPSFQIDYKKLLDRLESKPKPVERERTHLMPFDATVPLVVYVDGERHIIGSARFSCGQGSCSIFTNLPDTFKRIFDLGAKEFSIAPIEPPIMEPRSFGFPYPEPPEIQFELPDVDVKDYSTADPKPEEIDNEIRKDMGVND